MTGKQKKIIFGGGAMAVALVVLVAGLMSQGWLGGSKQGIPLAERPGKEIMYGWRYTMTGGTVGPMAMTWNGREVLFALRLTEGTKGADKGNGLLLMDTTTGKYKATWQPGMEVRNIAMSGAGEAALVTATDGRTLFYPSLATPNRSIEFPATGRYSLSPKGTHIVAEQPAKSGQGRALAILDNKGTPLWEFPETSMQADARWLARFPFLDKANQLLRVTPAGEAILTDGLNENPAEVWRAKAPVPAVATASTLLSGSVIAIAGGELGRKLLFLNPADGKTTGEAEFPVAVSSLECANIAPVCAAYGNSEGGQWLAVYDQQGNALWGYHVPGKAARVSSIVISSKGGYVVAGFQEVEGWHLQAWGADGTPRWRARLEGGLQGFLGSWNGEKIFSANDQGNLVFHDVKTQMAKMPGAKIPEEQGLVIDLGKLQKQGKESPTSKEDLERLKKIRQWEQQQKAKQQ